MPYIETTFGGDPLSSWRHAEHVFRTVARSAHRMKENLNRHQPPETVRVAEEPDYAEDDAIGRRSALGEKLKAAARASLLGASLVATAGAAAKGAGRGHDDGSLADRLVKPVASWASKAGGEVRKGLEALSSGPADLCGLGGARRSAVPASADASKPGDASAGRKPLVPLERASASAIVPHPHAS